MESNTNEEVVVAPVEEVVEPTVEAAPETPIVESEAVEAEVVENAPVEEVIEAAPVVEEVVA